jgi:hypothetical protein
MWKLAFAFALAAFFVERLSLLNDFDHDGFHQMALFRQWLRAGALPLDDPFSFTGTIRPVVHHEWGAGALLYGLATAFGGAGVMAARWLVSGAVAVIAALVALRRGPAIVAVFCAPIAMILAQVGFTTIRAGLYTMLFLSVVLYLVDRDRDHARPGRFLLAYLPVVAVWVNLHAGWVVGVFAVGLHAVEQLWRRRPAKHLLAALALTPLLMLATPYGRHYPPAWWHGITHSRERIPEWGPLWNTEFTPILAAFGLAMLLVVYAVVRRGPRALPGLLLVGAAALAALRHERHAALFAVIWFCALPGYLASTPLAELLQQLASRPRVALALTIAGFSAGIALLAIALPHHPLTLRLPAQAGDLGKGIVYPAGAVDHLDRAGFKGRLVTSFLTGGFSSWKLHPRALVSLDSRYEAAYTDAVVTDNLKLFQSRAGWREILRGYAPDAILIERGEKLATELGRETSMAQIYEDDLFEVWARPDLGLPRASRRGQVIPTSFP